MIGGDKVVNSHLSDRQKNARSNTVISDELYVGGSASHGHAGQMAVREYRGVSDPGWAGWHSGESERRAWQDPTLVGGYVAHREQWL